MTVVDHVALKYAGAAPDITTTELLDAAAAGDAESWRQLVERFEPAVKAALVGFRLQPDDVRDAEQATWLRMVEHHDRLREPEALGGWLRTTARREGLRILRERRRTGSTDMETLEAPDRSVDLEQAIVDADMIRRLDGLIDRLPTRSAALVRVLFCDSPPAYAEVAQRTGVPIGSIGPTRARALRTLRRLLDGSKAAVSVPASRPVVRA
jgi:RNA polymerase sigma factor (sigma-70 family)